MSVFLDTDVLVDCLRGTEAAEEWLEANPRESFQIPGIVAMELIIGCQNKAALKRTQKFLQSFEIAWPEAPEFERAYEILSEKFLTSSISIPDCIIAAMALERSIQLYSFNLRDFGQIEDLVVKSPYERPAKTHLTDPGQTP